MILTVQEAVRALSLGKTVVVPTETVYGLAARASDPHAVAEVYRIKKRPVNNPLILHFSDVETIKKYTSLPDLVDSIASFWPGPLTLLLPHGGRVSGAITAGSSFVACRIPDHPLLLQILKALGEPLAAPSANFSGASSPTCVEDLDTALLEQTAGVVDGGPCRIGIESTIIRLEKNRFQIVRPGLIGAEALRSAGFLEGGAEKPIAPGQAERHYAPRVPLILLTDQSPGQHRVELKDCCYLDSGQGRFASSAFGQRVFLSRHGNLEEVAHNLFHAFHATSEIRFLAMEMLPEEGCGPAINDRLRRAATLTGKISADGLAVYVQKL